MASPYSVVLITASGRKEAEKISKSLVSGRLAACVNVVPGIRSRYWWKGKIETARESLLIVKTRKSAVAGLIRKVRAIHSYAVPEIIALPVLEGNADYLKWIQDSVH